MTGVLIGHSQPQATDRYADLAADPLRAASDALTGRIAAALGTKSLQAIVDGMRSS